MKVFLAAVASFVAVLPATSVAQAPVRRPRTAAAPSATAAAAATQAPAVKAFDPTSLDTTCAPCKDFFQFSNGSWLKRTEIPAAYATWGSFTELDDRNKKVLHEILDDAAAKPGPSG